MTGPDRGRKKDSVAEVVGDVKRIMAIAGAHQDIRKLFSNNSENLRTHFINGYCERNGTLASSRKKYCISLIDFCKYLTKSGTEVEGVESSRC